MRAQENSRRSMSRGWWRVVAGNFMGKYCWKGEGSCGEDMRDFYSVGVEAMKKKRLHY